MGAVCLMYEGALSAADLLKCPELCPEDVWTMIKYCFATDYALRPVFAELAAKLAEKRVEAIVPFQQHTVVGCLPKTTFHVRRSQDLLPLIAVCLRSERGHFRRWVDKINPMSIIDSLRDAIRQDSVLASLGMKWEFVMPMI